MAEQTFDKSELQKLTRQYRPTGDTRQPENGVSSPSPQRVREAVREANDPKRLVSDPQNSPGR
jgi:hypothetical protein